MPARWQSSQRPLFVRTIWVNGLRHAVLSADDPLLLQYRKPQRGKSRPGSSSSVQTFTSSCSSASVGSRRHNCTSDATNSSSCCSDLQPCLIKLQLVLNDSTTSSSSSAGHERSARRHRTSSSRPSTLFRTEDEEDGDSSPTPQCTRDERKESNSRTSASMVGHYRRPYLPHVFPSSSDDEEESLISREHDLQNSWLFSEVQSLLPDIQLNPLSERVLQWLDLAGRTTEKEDARLEKRFRPSPLPPSQPAPPPPPPVVLERKPSCQPRRSILRHHGRALSTITAHSTPSEAKSPEPQNVDETTLSVTARGLNATRTRRSKYDEARAVIDITEPCPLPPVKVQSPLSTPPPAQPLFQLQRLPPSPVPNPSPTPPPSSSISCNRPQLHIFMPVLPREKPKKYFPEDVSECDSYWSEA